MERSGPNNIDARFQEEDRAGTGVIIRDCQGKGLAQWSEIIPHPLTVVELETLTASKALQCVADLSLNDVSLEGDSEIIINTLNEDSHSLASFGLPIQDVKCFANLFHCIRFSHVRKEGNSVAHNLIRHAGHVTVFQVWMKDVPSHTVDTYHANLPTI